MRIRNKLLVSIIVPIVVIFVSIAWFSYRVSHKVLLSEIRAKAENMLKAYSWRLDADIYSLEAMTKGLANAVQSLKPATEEEAKSLIMGALEVTPSAFGSTISFEPGEFSSSMRLVGPYYYRDGDSYKFVELGDGSTYNYPNWDWYKIPKETGKPHWSEPYIDEGGGNIAMITYSVPFYKNGKFWGVVTVDVALKSITEEIEKIKIGKSGFAFLLSHDGKFLTMLNKDWNSERTIFSAAKEVGKTEFEELGLQMTGGNTGFLLLENIFSKKPAWYIYGPIPSTGGSMAIVFPEDEMFADLFVMHRNIIMASTFGVLIMIILLFVISGKLVKPIRKLSEDAKKIAGGDFTASIINLKGNDELGVLARSFGEMKISLVDLLSNIRQEKEMFKTCFSKMTDGIVIMEPDYKVVQFNETASKLLMLPSNIPLIEHIEAHFKGSVPIGEVFEDAKNKSNIFELSRNETEVLGELYLRAYVTPIFDEKNVPKLIVMSIRDVTKEQSEEKSKSNFLSLISHKLRTPVTVLQSSVSVIEDGLLGELTDKQKRHIKSMANQIGKLDGLIEKLIGFVTIEQAEFETNRDDINLNEFFGNLIPEAKIWYPEKKTEISFSAGDGVDKFHFNKKYFRLISAQLIDNGLKFNLSEPASVAVKTFKNDGMIVISFTDNGVGIPPEYLDKIFDKFYQIEKYFTGNVEGVGLGLTYVKDIIEHFGGRIEVSSKPGEGSEFKVILP